MTICAWLDLSPRLVGLDQFVIGFHARLALGLTGPRGCRHPFALALQHLVARHILAFFLGIALGLLLQIGRVVAFIRNAPATVQFKDPAGDVVEEIAVMGDDQDRAGIGRAGDVPASALISASRWLVGSSSSNRSGCFNSSWVSATRRRSPPDRLSTDGIARRTPERVHRLLDLGIEVPQIPARRSGPAACAPSSAVSSE